jgi:RimJ/RimL family protein N-acetyltransferase
VGRDGATGATESFETERLVMRPIELPDVEQLVALDSGAEVMRYLTRGEPTASSEVEVVVRQRLGTRWMAYERETKGFVGWFGAKPTCEDQYELGYRLARRYWGRGFATEGAPALVDKISRPRAPSEIGHRQWLSMSVPDGHGALRAEVRASFHLSWENRGDRAW